MLTGQKFLDEVEAFLARTKMKPTAFGRACVGDPSLVPDLRKGRMPSLRLVERVSSFLESHDADSAPAPERAPEHEGQTP